MIGKKYRLAVVAHADFVGVLFAAQRSRCKPRADLDALDGVDAHQRRGEIAVEFAVNGRAETNGYAFRDNLDDGTNRGTAFANIVEIAFEELRLFRIRTEERIALDLVPVPARGLDPVLAHLDQRATHAQARHHFARDRAGSDARGGLARGLTATAAIIADAVFGVVRVIGVAGPVFVLAIGVLRRALIDIVDQERNRGARRDLFAAGFVDEHAGEDFHLVRFAPLRGEARLTWPPFVKIGLDIRLGQREARRAAVDHATDRDAVALAEGRDPEQVTEGVE